MRGLRKHGGYAWGGGGLKGAHGNRCQVCGYAPEGAGGSDRSGAPHVRPPHDGGAGTRDSRLVLRPERRAGLGHVAMRVGELGAIGGKSAKGGRGLAIRDGHLLDPGNVWRAMKKAAAGAGSRGEARP